MEENKKKKEYIIIPTMLLGGQIVFILCDVFGVSFLWLEKSKNLFDESTFLLNVLMIIFCLYILCNKAKLENAMVGLLVCILNFVLVNKLHHDQTWIGLRNGIVEFVLKYRIGNLILFGSIVGVSTLVMRWGAKWHKRQIEDTKQNKEKSATEEGTKKKTRMLAEQRNGVRGGGQPISNENVNIKNDLREKGQREKNYKWCFLGVLTVIIVLIFIILVVVIKQTEIPIAQNSIQNIAMILVFFASMTCLALALAATIAKYICDILFNNENKDMYKTLTGDKVVKVAINLFLTPIVYGIGVNGTYTEGELLEWLFSGKLLPIIISSLICYFLSSLIVATAFSILTADNWDNMIKKIVGKTLNSVIDICDNLVSSLIGLIKVCGPDFAEALIALLLEEEDEKNQDKNRE